MSDTEVRFRKDEAGRAARLAAAGLAKAIRARIEDEAPIIEITKLTVELYRTLLAEVSAAMLQGMDSVPVCKVIIR
jgi:hypothetical protein